MRTQRLLVCCSLFSLTPALSSCGLGNQNDSRAPERVTDVAFTGASSALASSASATPIVFSFSVPFPETIAKVGVVANGSLSIDDRALLTSGSSAGIVTNSGTSGTNIGTDITLNSVISAAAVQIRSRSKVASLITASTATIDPSASVTTVKQHASLAPYRTYAWTVTPPSCTGNEILTPNAKASISAGSYCSVTVNAGASLSISGSGPTFIQNLDVEPSASLVVSDAKGPAQLYVTTQLLWKGSIRSSSGNAASMLVGYAGTNAVNITAPLSGTIVAPTASVTLSESSLNNSGAIVALNAEVSPGTHLNLVPFTFSAVNLTLDPNTLIALKAELSTFIGSSQFANFVTSILSSFATDLTLYQVDLLTFMLYLNANADLIQDPSVLTV